MTRTIKRSSPDVLDWGAFYQWLNPKLPHAQVYDRARLLSEYAEVTEAVYDEFLGMLPPMNFSSIGFSICEATTDDIRLAFFKINRRLYAAYVSDSDQSRWRDATRALIAAQEAA